MGINSRSEWARSPTFTTPTSLLFLMEWGISGRHYCQRKTISIRAAGTETRAHFLKSLSPVSINQLSKQEFQKQTGSTYCMGIGVRAGGMESVFVCTVRGRWVDGWVEGTVKEADALLYAGNGWVDFPRNQSGPWSQVELYFTNNMIREVRIISTLGWCITCEGSPEVWRKAGWGLLGEGEVGVGESWGYCSSGRPTNQALKPHLRGNSSFPGGHYVAWPLCVRGPQLRWKP